MLLPPLLLLVTAAEDPWDPFGCLSAAIDSMLAGEERSPMLPVLLPSLLVLLRLPPIQRILPLLLLLLALFMLLLLLLLYMLMPLLLLVPAGLPVCDFETSQLAAADASAAASRCASRAVAMVFIAATTAIQASTSSPPAVS